MMQCLSGCRVLSPVCTHISQPRSRSVAGSAAGVSSVRRGSISVVVLRAESEKASSSSSSATVEPPVEPSVEDFDTDEVALASPAPTPKSLITEEVILSAISGDNIIVEDHYGRLGVNLEASTSEIIKAFQDRRAELNERELEGSDSLEILSKLQDSVDVLTSEEERRMYDWCLLRKATHTVDYAWPYESDLTQRLDDPTSLVVKPEDDGGNRKVALFFAGWFLLSCFLTFLIGFE